MFRSKNPLLAVLLAAALSAAGAGCTTFSDNDAVARVGDTEFTQEAFEAQLTDLGAADDITLDAEAVRGVITEWIVGQISDQPFDEDQLRATYEGGTAESGAACLAVIVVEDEATATSVAASIDGGTPFADAFASSNIDQQLVATTGALPCITGPDLEDTDGVPFLAAAIELTADAPLAVAPLLDEAGNEVAWVVEQFRPFDELPPEDLGILSSSLNGDIDVHVDPRYGVFDRDSSQVVALS